MCDRESFAKIRDSIADLQKADAAQSEQIKTLFNASERQGRSIDRLTALLTRAMIFFMFVLLAAVIYGALGERGFNAVTSAAGDFRRAPGTRDGGGDAGAYADAQRNHPNNQKERKTK